MTIGMALGIYFSIFSSKFCSLCVEYPALNPGDFFLLIFVQNFQFMHRFKGTWKAGDNNTPTQVHITIQKKLILCQNLQEYRNLFGFY